MTWLDDAADEIRWRQVPEIPAYVTEILERWSSYKPAVHWRDLPPLAPDDLASFKDWGHLDLNDQP